MHGCICGMFPAFCSQMLQKKKKKYNVITSVCADVWIQFCFEQKRVFHRKSSILFSVQSYYFGELCGNHPYSCSPRHINASGWWCSKHSHLAFENVMAMFLSTYDCFCWTTNRIFGAFITNWWMPTSYSFSLCAGGSNRSLQSLTTYFIWLIILGTLSITKTNVTAVLMTWTINLSHNKIWKE